MSSSSEEEEIIIENSYDDEMDDGETEKIEVIDFSSLDGFVNTVEALLPTFHAEHRGGLVTIAIPSNVLPLSQLCVYGFNFSDILLNIELKFTKTPNFTQPPEYLKHSNPMQNENYIGKPLIANVYKKFFSSSYHPQSIYNCAVFLFADSSYRPSSSNIKTLTNEGIDSLIASNTLSNCKNDISKAREMLLTGNFGGSKMNVQLPIGYDSCPLFYFILEIIDTFLSIPYVCCFCGKRLPQPCLKPTTCPDNQFCRFTLETLGVGNSLIQEIRRDPLAADFVFSTFANALNTTYLNPQPPDDILRTAQTVVSTLPSMEEIADCCFTDIDLNRKLGKESTDLLRFVLFSNKNQFIHIPRTLEIRISSNPFQFMTLTASPEKEAIFQSLKNKYGSIFLFHGSNYDRWYSIFHNGLINATGTGLMSHGSALGSGIYFAPDAGTSFGYCSSCQNQYKNSQFKQYSPIALCEVAKVPDLKNHGWAYTLRQENACIVRFLLIGSTFSGNFTNVNLPTLDQVLKEIVKNQGLH